MTTTIRFVSAVVATVGIVALAGGYGRAQEATQDSKTAQKDTADARPNSDNASTGGATPQATFDAAVAAMKKEDWKAFTRLLTKESQDGMAGMMAMGGMMMQAFAELGGEEGAATAKKVKQVMEKHGLSEAFLKKLEDGGPPKDEDEAFKALVKPIKDRNQFIADMMAAFNAMSDADATPVPAGAVLKDVEIEGDTAKAQIQYERDGKKKSEPVAFKKVGGKWLMDITESMKGQPDDEPLDGEVEELPGLPESPPDDRDSETPPDLPELSTEKPVDNVERAPKTRSK